MPKILWLEHVEKPSHKMDQHSAMYLRAGPYEVSIGYRSVFEVSYRVAGSAGALRDAEPPCASGAARIRRLFLASFI